MKTPIHITPSRASKTAIRTIEKLGGSVFCKYYNPLALRDCVKGSTEHLQAAPTKKTDIRKLSPYLKTYRNLTSFNSLVHFLEEPRLPVTGSSLQNACGRRPLEGTFEAAAVVQRAGHRAAKVTCTFALCKVHLSNIDQSVVSIRSGDILRLRDRYRGDPPFSFPLSRSGEILRLRDRYDKAGDCE